MESEFSKYQLCPLSEGYAAEISQWEYDPPYAEYSFKGYPDDWLMDRSTWGTEQFCLVNGDNVVAQVACQFEGDDLWVGWSLSPNLCGKGSGAQFVSLSVMYLTELKKPTGRILLRVAARNKRAIKAYQKAGFNYLKTIQDEIAYTNHMEDFWVMVWTPTKGNLERQ